MADVTLPQLGETVTEGTITRWFKNVGDTVRADEPLFEVSTDKVDTEVPSPIAGTLSEIRVQAGETVAVGTVIAVVGASSAAAPAPAAAAPVASVVAAPAPAPAAAPKPAPAPAAAPKPAPAPAAAPAPAPTRAPAAALPTNIVLSPVVRRLITDHGIDVAALRGTGPGGRITREDVLDYIDAHGLTRSTAPAAAPAPAPAPAPAAAPAPAPAPAAAPAPVAAPAPAAAPAAAPVAAPAPAPAAAPAPRVVVGARDEVVPLSKIRRLTGSHMVASKSTAPHAFSVVEVDYANVDVARNASKDSFKSTEGFSLTYLPFISRAIVDAIAHFPHMNASLDGDTLVVHKYIDLGIAVDLEYQGLLVPVVRGAEGKRLRAIAREINDLASRARTRKLSPDEIQGGTFTISNNGSAGSVLTMAIINQPQVAIISTDAIVRKPVAV
ncbi:MAG: 2-oxo acid dehydrogenase subunit E2, partial [Acidimicrobiia bacterium]|nr:2-oxo acid dehydrogenase subunit E2 [Acidimicrobiia bacterium]